MTYETLPSPEVLAQAEHWFTRLHADHCTLSERQTFQHWHAHPLHAAAYRQTEALWRDVGDLKQHASIQELSAEVLAQTAPRRRRGEMLGMRRSLAVAAGMAILAVALGLSTFLLDGGNVYATGLGEQRTVMLEDGSRVTLNTETRLKVNFSEGRRDLVLFSGEALFDVAHDSTRPFLVTAGLGSVTALGTRFQVRRDVGAIKVTLLEGRVRVDSAEAAAPVEMTPGEQLLIAKANPEITRRRVDSDAALSWTSGRMVFRATPLSEAVAEANRYAKIKIRIADESLSRLQISGTFVTGDSELLAAALQADMPVQADFSGDREIVLRRR